MNRTPRIKRVTRRNNAPRNRSLYSGIATQVVVVFGCLWLVGFLGCVAWYLKTANNNNTPARSTSGAQSIAEKLAPLKQQRQQKQQVQVHDKKKEEETEAPGPQTGVKHLPNLLPLSTDPDAYRSPLLIFTCQRAKYLSQTLDDILENIGDHCAFGCPVVVSEDGTFMMCSVLYCLAEWMPDGWVDDLYGYD
jgi:hypothetical protein